MKIVIASGKGGTGKTTVATNLAFSLGNSRRVQLLDCDVEEPNCHLFFDIEVLDTRSVKTKVPNVRMELCTLCSRCTETCVFNAIAVAGEEVLVFPTLCHSCGGCSYFCPTGAITEKDREIGVVKKGKANNLEIVYGRLNIGEAIAIPVIHAVKKQMRDDRIVILDAPPGTSCSVVTSVVNADFCLLITEPTPFGLNDLKLAVGVVKKLGVPAGVVINRANMGDESIHRYCREEGIPILLEIPFEERFAKVYARGKLLCEEYLEMQEQFLNLFADIEGRLERARDSSYKRKRWNR